MSFRKFRDKKFIMAHVGKYFFIRHADSLYVLDILEKKTGPGVKVGLWDEKTDPNDQENQLWYYHYHTNTIRSKMNDFCLDVKEKDGRREFREVIMNPFDSFHTMRWIITDEGIICMRNREQLLLEVCDDQPGAGGELRLGFRNDDHKHHIQRFMVRYASPSCFFIHSRLHKKVLDVDAHGVRAHAPRVIMSDVTDNHHDDSQLWYEGRDGFIRCKLNGFALDVGTNFDGEPRTVVNPFDDHNPDHRWAIEGDFIVNHYRNGEVLDIRRADKSDGAEVMPFHRHGADNQRWDVDFTEKF